MKKPASYQFGTRSFRNLTIGLVIIFIFGVTVLTISVLQYNKHELLSGVRNSLQTVLNTTTEGLKIWMVDKKLFIEQLGTDTNVIQAVRGLQTLDPTPKALLASQDLAKLRHFLAAHQIQNKSTGFFVIDSDFTSIFSLRDENIGSTNFIARERPDLLQRVFQGETVFVPPVRSDVYLGKNTTSAQLPSSIFFMAPVIDKEQNIIAAIAMRLDPAMNFSRVIQLGRMGKSGETYAFDSQGLLLSESRFTEQLRQVGLINQDEQAILKIHITDPGTNLLLGGPISDSQAAQPFTFMAESALRGESGENMEGYRDYRGVPVYGAWLWESSLGIGLTMEINIEEALSPYLLLRRTVLGILAVVLFSSATGIMFTIVFGERAYRIMKATQDSLEEQVSQRTSELQKNEKSLRKALEISEAAKRTKSTFLANMSHEIRTPMNAIIGFTDVLLQTDLSDTQHKHLNTVRRSAKSLLSLLNNILDISKLEEGKMKLEEVCFALPRTVEDVMSTLGMKAQEKEITLHLHYDDTLPNCFVGDPARLGQVLMNLIGNAIKFTDTGRVSLRIEPYQQDDFLHFMVQDTGIGIPEDRLKKIFLPFTQSDASTTRKHGGTGLGTTISQQIVEQMSGQIWVESEEGRGSTFHFIVHILQAECTAKCLAGKGEAPIEFRATRRLSILIAEDIPENIELVTIRLTAVGHQLAVATNGRKAVQMVTDNKKAYDLILMDIHMPEVDGLEATRQIRKLETERGSHTPIIALSASVLKEDRWQCQEAGMDGFISKPIDFPELFDEIARVVPQDSGKPMDDLQIIPEQMDGRLPQLSGLDTKLGLKNWRNVNRYIISLKSFSRKHRQDYKQIKEAVARGDLKAAKEITHALKGVAGNLAVPEVSTVSTQLHEALKNKQGDYNLLIHKLTNALKIAVDSIESLNDLPTEAQGESLDKYDSLTEQKLFNDLLAALDADDLDLIEPLLDQLKGFHKDSQVSVIAQLIENFEFRGAEQILKELALTLNVDMEESSG